MEKKIEKKYLVSYIITFELVPINFHYYEENSRHRQC